MRPLLEMFAAGLITLIFIAPSTRVSALPDDLKSWMDAIEPPEVKDIEFFWQSSPRLQNATSFRLGIIEAKVVKLIASGKDVNASDARGFTPLIYSILATGDAVPILIEKGADINATTSTGMTPLLYALFASQYGNGSRIKQSLQIARLLVERGANVSASNKSGETPLMLAADNCDDELTSLLLQKGALANLKDAKGLTAQRRAKAIGCSKVLAVLKQGRK